MRIFWVTLIAIGSALFAPLLAAQTIEKLEWSDTPGESVAWISFIANVHYLRQVPRADEWSDRWQLSFQLVAADEAVLNQVVEEGKRLVASAGRPQLDLSYVPLSTVPTKLLTLRFSSPVQVAVRQGSSAREIELHVRSAGTANGDGASAPAVLPTMADSAEERHYAVLLQHQQTDDGVAHLPKPLADYALFTRPNSATANALMLGYFRTATDAANVAESRCRTFRKLKSWHWKYCRLWFLWQHPCLHPHPHPHR